MKRLSLLQQVLQEIPLQYLEVRQEVPVSHSTGATVKHVLTSDDLTAFAAGISPVATLGFSGSTSGITTLQATAIAGTNTLSLPPTTTDTLAGIAATQTLTNKTLTAPKINLSLTHKQELLIL
jgi:hypothetical protein